LEALNLKEKLRKVVHQAQFNGFEFRSWFEVHIDKVWPGAEEALDLLAGGERYYALLSSHEFAQSFWRSGAQMSFLVPSITYSRVTARGEVI
jgi:hypothetical protein